MTVFVVSFGSTIHGNHRLRIDDLTDILKPNRFRLSLSACVKRFEFLFSALIRIGINTLLWACYKCAVQRDSDAGRKQDDSGINQQYTSGTCPIWLNHLEVP